MKKKVGRISLWVIGCICIVVVCVKMIQPVTEKELINSENYLVTTMLEAGDVLEQSIALQREGLCMVEVAFVFETDISDECKALVEIISGGEMLAQSMVQVNLLPNNTLTPFKIPRDIGDEVTLRITNVSEKRSDAQFSLLYTDSSVRMFGNVSMYELNGQPQQGQLISQYTYKVGYDYYKAFSTAFGILLICMALESVLFKIRKEFRYENQKFHII